MSSDYFFNKWKRVLVKLEEIVNMDFDYQECATHSKDLCLTVQRLSDMLSGYSAVFNDATDCLRHNTQVQKTQYIADVIKAVSKRILELKHQLTKLEKSHYQFVSRGAADMHLTTADTELIDIPEKAVRLPQIQAIIEDLMRKAEEVKEKEREEKERALVEEQTSNEEVPWFLQDENKCQIVEKESLDEEQLQRRNLLNLIAAQEKCRQVIAQMKHKKQKIELWKKELMGTAKPPARPELRHKAASIIQRIVRVYFEVKRRRVIDCKLDEKLGIRMCRKPSDDARNMAEKINQQRVEIRMKYEKERDKFCKDAKDKYVKYKVDEVKEDYRDEIRAWFQKWYKEAWLFCDIPKQNQGGSTLILMEEMLPPEEWLEENERYMQQMKGNKAKNKEQLKREKKEAKREEQLLKKQQQAKAKQELQLLKKMMKNPNQHPGFKYPQAKETVKVLKAIQNYHNHWHDVDLYERDKAKNKFIKEIDEENIRADVKREVRPEVDIDMRKELKKLKRALKEEYETFEEEMPPIMPQRFPKLPKEKKIKMIMNDAVAEKMLNLVLKGILKEYLRTKFEDFKGEPNFAGDDLRCNFIHAVPFGGETRNIWWDRCRELSHGFHKILLVGPRNSGKTVLVHSMATVNDAILFELDPVQLNEESGEELKETVNSIAICAKAVQPAVIYIRHLHRLLYKKKPSGEPELNTGLLIKFLLKRISKKFGKGDRVTIIGTCADPWLTKSNLLLKEYPTVLLMPNTTYTTTRLLLSEWVLNNRAVPTDLDISSLAQVVQGYSYGYLKKSLEDFLSDATIVKIAAYGLTPEEVYDYIAREEGEKRVEYDLYLNWYSEKTQWGQMERKHLQQQHKFQELVRKYAEKKDKKKKMKSAATSIASSIN